MIELDGGLYQMEESPDFFSCRYVGESACEGRMRKGPFSGFACTKHMNVHAEELGVFEITDNPTVVQGNDDWARRHPKPRRRAKP